MKGLVSSRAAAVYRGLLLVSLALLAVLVQSAFLSSEVRYDLWINGKQVAEELDSDAIRTALTAWSDERKGWLITLEYGGRGWRYSMEELGMLLPMAEAARQVDQGLARRPWWQRSLEIHLDLSAGWDPARLEAALAPVEEEVERLPLDARLAVEEGAVRIYPSMDGIAVDRDALRRALLAHGEAQRLSLPVQAVKPWQSTEVVEGWGIRRLVAEWTTHYDPTIPRADNVERAARAFDGLVLKPGEILSYNATVGPIDASTGWKEAKVIVAGELVPGIGGGVCQVATTLYGAALRANLEIMERHPHQLAVSYIPPSEDAAVAQGYQDLKIRNTMPGHLLLQTDAWDGTVTFRLYGDLPPGQEVKIESKVTGSVPVPTRTVVDPSLAPGQQVATDGIPGLTSEAYRLVFQNGELVKRERLSQDRYLPTAAVLRVGAPAAAGQ